MRVCVRETSPWELAVRVQSPFHIVAGAGCRSFFFVFVFKVSLFSSSSSTACVSFLTVGIFFNTELMRDNNNMWKRGGNQQQQLGESKEKVWNLISFCVGLRPTTVLYFSCKLFIYYIPTRFDEAPKKMVDFFQIFQILKRKGDISLVTAHRRNSRTSVCSCRTDRRTFFFTKDDSSIESNVWQIDSYESSESYDR